MNNPKTIRMTILATAIAAACSWATAQDVTLYESHTLPEALVFEPKGTLGMETKIDMIVQGPGDFYVVKSFEAGEPIELSPQTMAEGGMPDGTYQYELRIMGITGVAADRDSGKPAIAESLQGGFGAFSILDGRIVSQELSEPAYKGPDAGTRIKGTSLQTAAAAEEDSTRDQVIVDDLIVDGSLCVGFDCVNGENFGFDTIRLKENNTRLKFEDTSSTGSFPSTDWQLTANDSANGGQNKFSIEDITGGRIPFTIEGGTPSNTLYVDSTGRVGFGTSTPVLHAHIADGNTPGLRLEQDGSSGFAAQIWDVAGNEANFFVRDVTNSSKLPFRIRPGAPTSSIDITASGNVGIGVASADTKLHVSGTNGSTSGKIEEASGTNAVRTMLTLENNGGSRLRFEDTSSDSFDWLLTANSLGFAISEDFSGVQEFMLEHATGNLTIAGTLTQNSDRSRKTNIQAVDPEEVLRSLADLPIATWAYKEDANTIHLGPMAQDFYQKFGLGNDERKIATIDTSGVALAAIQGLMLRLEQKEARVKALEREVEKLSQTSARQVALERKLEVLVARLQTVEAVQDFETIQQKIWQASTKP